MEEKPKDLGGERYENSERVQELDFEEYQRTSVYFSGYEGDDEVFESETTETVKVIKEPQVRRISDVIDSIGDLSLSPGPVKRQSFTEFTDVSSSFVKRTQEYHLDVKELGRSPPPTPCSDLGYDSTGCLSSPPSQLNYRPRYFRYSTSSMDTTSPSKWDMTDAKPMFPDFSNRERVKKGVIPVERDSSEYNMNHPRRGYAIIFNHEEFNSAADLPHRKGSHVDTQYLEEVYKILGFDVKTYNNLDCDKVQTTIKNLAEVDHSDCDCLLVTVLTHGLKSNYLFAKDFAYPTEALWMPFTADKCISLAGKPKIFIIQACRGDALDQGVMLMGNTQTDGGTTSYKIPTMADFLIAYSTAEGYYSWRNPENGTWFIQSLCKVLAENYLDLDFLKIMTRVSQIVAIDYESYNDFYVDKNEQKQVPNLHSTLIRDIFFKPKV